LATVGNGGASKEQVGYMVASLLGLAEQPQPYDITDALAVAYCHYQRRGVRA
jgi:crossover junction endodeoxyribonuclease RuvC